VLALEERVEKIDVASDSQKIEALRLLILLAVTEMLFMNSLLML
jgi:hypothetical protein